MVDSTGLIALGLGVGGTYIATQTLGSGSNEGGGSGRGGFSGLPPQAQGQALGIPSINRNVGNKKVNYSPSNTSKTVNVNTQPRAGSGSKKEERSGGSEGNENSGSGGTKKESNTTNDISRDPSETSGGSGEDLTPTDPVTGTETVSKKAQQKAGVQADTSSGVTTELNRQQGYTRTQTTAEMDTPSIGGSKKESKSSTSQFGQGSITSGEFFRGSIF